METEKKIKLAARKVFQAKGYDAARTRVIAEEAGVNLALINYYYRSKEALFNEIMQENLELFRRNLYSITNDPNTTPQEKLELIVENYYDIFQQEPAFLTFIFKEITNRDKTYVKKLNHRGILRNSFLEKQLVQAGKSKDEINQIFINIVSLVIFPFIGSPIIRKICELNNDGFKTMMDTRKKEIPLWITNMFNL